MTTFSSAAVSKIDTQDKLHWQMIPHQSQHRQVRADVSRQTV